MAEAVSPRSQASGAGWPEAGDSKVVVFRFASSPAERAVLDDWLQEAGPEASAAEVLDAGDELSLEHALSSRGDPWIAPVRVAWLPRERSGARSPRLLDLLPLRNARRPRKRFQQRILRHEPDRCRVVVAEPARASELRDRFDDGGGDDGLTGFVGRQAVLALDRAERKLIGTQYKLPRFVSEEIRSSGPFRGAVAALAGRLGRGEDELRDEAAGYIDEMVASQSELAIDAWGQFGGWLSRAYTVEVDESRTTELRELSARHALVFLPSHRSYLDPLVLRSALHGQGFPPNHVMGGVNVSFWPIGPVARRSGYVFIRRSFRDNDVYKLALRQYMGYLLRKRFNLEWYIEGGRSRTGKLRPPRYGLLTYLVDAFREGEIEDACLVPASIVYDQLHEVGAMAAEERGAQKQAESLGWLVGYARSQGRRLGTVRVSFGQPLSLREALDEPDQTVEKVAFEICHRINRTTPITPTALVALALLGVEDRALTLAGVGAALGPLLDYVERRELPLAGGIGGGLDLRRGDDVRRALDSLARGGVITEFAEGLEPVWAVGPDRHLEAAFYRNGVIHFFVNRAIAELVLARVAEGQGADLRDQGWQEALRLRDLLKFEFFFPRKRDFEVEVREELRLLDPSWEQRPQEPGEAWAILSGARPHLAHSVLRPFLEAYLVVAERLSEHDPRDPVDEKELLAECIGVARQYRLQRRLHSPESISKEVFRTALRLAANRDLIDGPDPHELMQGRRALANEVRAEVRRVQAVRDLALRGLDPERSPR